MDKSQFIGITEAGDPSFNLDIFDRLYKGNIIITKRLTDNLIEKLVENKDKCILHLTCTGMGGTKIEPFVPDAIQTYTKFQKLISCGFPIEHVVLRIDPIIPTNKGYNTAYNVINIFVNSGIQRVRVSFLDMYSHVKKRFKENNVRLPYDDFHASYNDRMKMMGELQEISSKNGFELEVCGEPGIPSLSCISQRDIEILGLQNEITLEGFKGQRKSCCCPENKKELILGQKPTRCQNQCLYCFWK